MKTLQELYNEIIGSEDLKAAFTEAAKSGKVTEFLKAHGVDATAEEVAAFLKGQTGEVSDEELDNIAGGFIFVYQEMKRCPTCNGKVPLDWEGPCFTCQRRGL